VVVAGVGEAHTTPYVRIGDTLGWTALALSGFLALLLSVSGRSPGAPRRREQV
jgi:hypothetical protein